MIVGVENLNCFFNPKSIAVVGASGNKASLGALIFQNLNEGFRGSVIPVNEFRQTVQGVRAYPSVGKIPGKIDLAIVATPAHTIPQIIEDCGEAGVSGVIIVSAGFSECDPVGLNLRKQIIERKGTHGTRILGPNSLGVIRPRNNLYATFGDKRAVPGKIAFVSQSAALCGTVLDWSQETKVGLSAVVSVGFMLDVELSELIEYFGADSQTRAIMLYVESIKNVRSFMSAARGFARTKPIVIVKAGRFSKKGSFPLVNGAVLTEDALYDAAFRRIGVVRVDTVNDLFDCAKSLQMQPNPRSSSLTIITNADGPGVLAADQLALKGGKLAVISKASSSALKSILPYYCSLSNPVDLLEEATPQRFHEALKVCLDDSEIDSVLLIYSPQGVTKPVSLANIIVDLSKGAGKTVLVTLLGEDQECQEARRILQVNNVPTFKTAEEAVAAFMNMYTYTQNLELLYQTPEEIDVKLDKPLRLKGVIRRAVNEGRGDLNLQESLALLESYNIPIAKTSVAKSAKEASDIATQIGYPLVMKALQTSETSGNRLTTEAYSNRGIAKKYNQLMREIESNNLEEFQGIAMQPIQQSSWIKLFLGLRKHPRFGPIIVLARISETPGVLRDIAVGFPPLNQVLARRLMETAKLHQTELLGSTAFNASAVEQVIVKFSQLVLDFSEVKEIDIYPLVAFGSEVMAVDACVGIDLNKVMREQAEHDEPLIIAPYPKKYVTKRQLKNGLSVVFRPIKPEDELRFNELFKSLSQESVRFRFFQIIKELSHDTLSRYCNLDYDREIAIVAELPDGRIIGVVRLILGSDRKTGEFAIMVGDSWHGLGLGSKLMDYIIKIANDLKVEAIYSMVSSANYKMVNLCGKMGFEKKPVDESTVEMRKTVPAQFEVG
jgi:acetyltransferase